ncbi:Granzyme-like protein 2 [Galemys pyrenaicus]|uniref:Granzyme-like protein 2 n=1 Tax=Galemys pyrenaicus TaxID=202257 RepID=A0A8J5ZXP6_GALPY|nr:Granzyme-like protein 2 [Galemys pyrenaicus]
MALVHFYGDTEGHRYQCGGFLVRDDFVMTAAHSFGSNMMVTLGAHNINHWENTQQDIPVLRAFPHQGYDAERLVNDIMLLKLKNMTQLTSAVQTIALPCDRDWVEPGQVCSVAVWGKMDAASFQSHFRRWIWKCRMSRSARISSMESMTTPSSCVLENLRPRRPLKV